LKGPQGKLAATAPSLKQLDLTDNLISSWSTVAQVCQELPQLQLLNLSLNRLQLPRSLPDTGLQQLRGLQCLVLNQCRITWQQVRQLPCILECDCQRSASREHCLWPLGLTSSTWGGIFAFWWSVATPLGPQGVVQHSLLGSFAVAGLRRPLVQVAVLQGCLPNLQELHAAGNNISSLHVQQEPSTQQERRQHLQLVGFESLQVCTTSVLQLLLNDQHCRARVFVHTDGRVCKTSTVINRLCCTCSWQRL
jgi:Leucine-rich repeat (LRR) protein